MQNLVLQFWNDCWCTFMGVGKVQGAGAGWTGGKVRSPECRLGIVQ